MISFFISFKPFKTDIKSTFNEKSVIVAPNLSEENFWYYKEYVNMDMNDVIDMMSVVYKWIDQSASFEWIINPQETASCGCGASVNF